MTWPPCCRWSPLGAAAPKRDPDIEELAIARSAADEFAADVLLRLAVRAGLDSDWKRN